ncbi:hypothetical protein NMG60_11034923 [Bertholletia excelsa]
MVSLSFVAPFLATLNFNSDASKAHGGVGIANPTLHFPFSSRHSCSPLGHNIFLSVQRSHPRSNSYPSGEEEEEKAEEEGLVQDLRVPEHWLEPSKAVEESEWLRVSLHKWLDDEYCPEPTNVDISNVAAYSYYKSLVEKQTDLGQILLKMARELESISYQESFHGAFSSANAAINLIIERIEQG